jgi:hypothetical protein
MMAIIDGIMGSQSTWQLNIYIVFVDKTKQTRIENRR